jgi:hypothetical protein
MLTDISYETFWQELTARNLSSGSLVRAPQRLAGIVLTFPVTGSFAVACAYSHPDSELLGLSPLGLNNFSPFAERAGGSTELT